MKRTFMQIGLGIALGAVLGAALSIILGAGIAIGVGIPRASSHKTNDQRLTND
jgi:hypothetical protein